MTNKGVATMSLVNELFDKLQITFSNKTLFDATYITQKKYLSMYRGHARITGLFAKIGIDMGYLVDIGRKYSIQPIEKHNRSGKKYYQKQAETDISFISKDEPQIFIDYESADAPISKMKEKFLYLKTFRNNNPTIEIVSLFITITNVMHDWKKPDGCKETLQERQNFTKQIQSITKTIWAEQYNKDLVCIIGIFFETELKIMAYQNSRQIKQLKVVYK